MKTLRQLYILRIIAKKDIHTQDELINELVAAGHKTTQATISRDIKELRLIKIPDDNGLSKYSAPSDKKESRSKYIHIINASLVDFATSENIILLKTISGFGSAVGEAIDCLKFKHIIGSVAGDNTLLLVIDSSKNTASTLAEIKKVVYEENGNI